MKVAVTYENGQVFQHFGHTEQFKIYEIEDGAVIRSQIVDTDGNGHGALAGFLQGHKVEALICGGIGMGARAALDEAKIRLYGGVRGEADQAAADLAAGRLQYDPDVQCDRHGHDGHGEHGDHPCGHHSCGGH